MHCPNCNSERARRGGNAVWLVYLVLVGAAVPAVLLLELNAAIVGCVMIAAVVLAHLVLDQRVCLDCGHQWKGRSPGPSG